MALVLVACLEASESAAQTRREGRKHAETDGLVGSWFVAVRGLEARGMVDEMMRRLVASRAVGVDLVVLVLVLDRRLDANLTRAVVRFARLSGSGDGQVAGGGVSDA